MATTNQEDGMDIPLTLSTTCDHRPAIADARGINIASWDPATIELFGDVRPDIVKAVNSYEAMREALEKIIAYRDRVDPIHFQLEKMDHFLAQARKALALAEGKE